jgi:hypothetical protein
LNAEPADQSGLVVGEFLEELDGDVHQLTYSRLALRADGSGDAGVQVAADANSPG